MPIQIAFSRYVNKELQALSVVVVRKDFFKMCNIGIF